MTSTQIDFVAIEELVDHEITTAAIDKEDYWRPNYPNNTPGEEAGDAFMVDQGLTTKKDSYSQCWFL